MKVINIQVSELKYKMTLRDQEIEKMKKQLEDVDELRIKMKQMQDFMDSFKKQL